MVWFTALSTHLVGYFEGIGSERGLGWWCSDSLSPRDFPRLETGKLVIPTCKKFDLLRVC